MSDEDTDADTQPPLQKHIKIPGVDIDNIKISGVNTDNIEIPGVDTDNTPPIIETNDLDVAEHDPDPIEIPVPPIEADDNDNIENTSLSAGMDAQPVIPTLQRSTRKKSQPSRYVPSLMGTKYTYAAAQLRHQEVFNPDAHMFTQHKFYQAEPDLVATVITQILFKAGMNRWGNKAFKASHMEMKQLHMRNTFRPRHAKDLTHLKR